MVKKLFEVIGPRYKDRNGGYTRVLKAGYRYGNSAAVGVIEFVDRDEEAKGSEDLERHAAAVAANAGPRRSVGVTAAFYRANVKGRLRPPFFVVGGRWA